jgi:hypothetical protein
MSVHRLLASATALVAEALTACSVAPAPPAPLLAPTVQSPQDPPGTSSWPPWRSVLHDVRHLDSFTLDGRMCVTVRAQRKPEDAVTRSAGSIVAVAVTGSHRIVRHVDVGSTSYGCVVVAGKSRVHTTVDSAFMAVDDHSESAKVARRSTLRDDITKVSARPTADGTALLDTNGQPEWAYRTDDALPWQAPRFINYSSPAVTASSLAYVGNHAGNVNASDVRSGVVTARYGTAGGQVWSSTVVDKSFPLHFGEQNGHAYGFDGRRLFDGDLNGPVDSYFSLAAHGELIVGSDSGFVASLG